MTQLLAINTGSSSVKFSVFKLGAEIKLVLRGQISGIGSGGGQNSARRYDGVVLWEEAVSNTDHVDALDTVFDHLAHGGYLANISYVAHRIVHGGPDFTSCTKLTRAIEARLEKLVPLAPVHMQANIDGIAATSTKLPQATQYALFDTAFHADMPKLAQYTGLPLGMEDGRLRRYGFHGLSCEYALFELERRYGPKAANERIIVAHLGSGASMTAIYKGESIETTMGFTPLSGLPMAKRSGDIDTGLLLYLLGTDGWDTATLHDLLENRSGLLGLSGQSGDIRVLTAPGADADARFAVASFCYQARKHLGALVAALGGLDRLVFTGGIGENSAVIRKGICNPLAGGFGLRIDDKKNNRGAPNISISDASIKINIVKTDEAYIMARHIAALASNM